MCRLATESSSWIGVSDWEAIVQSQWTRVAVLMNAFHSALNGKKAKEILSRNKESSNYNVDNKEQEKNSNEKIENQSHQTVTLKFLCGGDLLDSFLVPNLWLNEHVKIILGYGIACIERENTNEREVIRKHEILSQFAENIDLIKISFHNTISSTIVRKLLKEKKSIKYMTEDAVIQYIIKSKLYE